MSLCRRDEYEAWAEVRKLDADIVRREQEKEAKRGPDRGGA